MKINAIGKNVNSSSNIFVSYRLDGSHEWLSIMIYIETVSQYKKNYKNLFLS